MRRTSHRRSYRRRSSLRLNSLGWFDAGLRKGEHRTSRAQRALTTHQVTPRTGGANGEQNRQNKVLNRDSRRKEQLIESTSCYVRAWFGTKRSEVQILSPRLMLSIGWPA